MTYTLTLKADEKVKLKELAKSFGYNKTNDFINKIVKDYIDEEFEIDDFDLKLAKVAKKQYAAIKSGKVKTTSWEEVQRENGLL